MVNEELHIIMPVKDSLEIAEKAIRAIVDSGHTLYVYDDNSLPENAHRLDELATELAKKDTGKTLFILDEPTTGLHFEDIRILLKVINRLADKGNTIVVIEHNLDIVRSADYVIDLGPGGGRDGGMIVAEGTPEEISKANTPTAIYLRKELQEIVG